MGRYSERCSERYSARSSGRCCSAEREIDSRERGRGREIDTPTAHLLWLIGARFIDKSTSVTRGRLICGAS